MTFLYEIVERVYIVISPHSKKEAEFIEYLIDKYKNRKDCR